jgi:predicted acetyltransferase
LSDRTWWDRLYDTSVAGRRILGVFSGSTVVAAARLHPYQQVWGGRPLPMAGIAGVTVAPEWRGQGVSALLMRECARRAVELGDVMSVLFPAALPPYRKLGWEIAGSVSRVTFAADALRRLSAPAVELRRAQPSDAASVADIMRRHTEGRRASGPLVVTEEIAAEALSSAENFAYLADDGFVSYAWYDGDLAVETAVGLSADTTRALWALVGSGASAVEKVHAWLAPDDPIHLVLDAKAALDVQEDHWMLRVLDVRQALEQRGYPLGAEVSVSFTVKDLLLPQNSGSFRLEVSQGRGAVVDAAGADGPTFGANGLAALFAGTPMALLRAAGLVRGGGDGVADPLLDTAFASRPYLLDRF